MKDILFQMIQLQTQMARSDWLDFKDLLMKDHFISDDLASNPNNVDIVSQVGFGKILFLKWGMGNCVKKA